MPYICLVCLVCLVGSLVVYCDWLVKCDVMVGSILGYVMREPLVHLTGSRV